MDIDDIATFQTPPKRRKVIPAIPRASSMSELLAAWGATKSPTSATQMRRESGGHGLRGNTLRQPISYAESPSSSPAKSEVSAFDDGQEVFDDQEDEEDEDESQDELSDDVIHVMPPGTLARQAAQRQAASRPAGTRQLPARSTRAVRSYASPVKKKKKKSAKRSNFKLTSDATSSHSRAQPKVETARNKVRADIAAYTKPKRDAFLRANKDYFMPLLPANNYIAKLERASIVKSEDVVEIPYRSLEEQPEGVKATMKPYQLEGLSFMVHMHDNGMSAILGDEMGLGKTLQTLSLFQYLENNHPTTGEHRPNLVVCPLSVLSSWIAEARKWVPGQNVIRFHGPKAERQRFMQECLQKKQRYGHGEKNDDNRVDLIVTTYETFTAEQNWFKRAFVWRYCVLDEGHKIKNDKSDVASALQGLSAEYRLLLTGTPLQNNLREMWALLHWLFPEVFTIDTADSFGNAFDLTKGKVSTSFMDDARRLLELVMLRRMKNSPGVNLGLPPKEEVLLYVPLTPIQRFWYTRLLTKSDKGTLNNLFAGAKDKEVNALQLESQDEQLALLEKAGAAVDGAEAVDTSDVWAENKAIMEEALQQEHTDAQTSDWKKLMNLLMQLRKVCSHPYLLPGAAPETYDIGEHVKNASGKFIVLEKLLRELVVEQGKKVLIFSGFTRTLNLVGELLQLMGANGYQAPFRYSRFDGGTHRAQRNLSIRLFNDMSSGYDVMLLSTRAGGLGINLTSATDVVFMDEDWNPQVTLQAEARAHRIGQTRKVTIYKLCAQGTVEEQMMGRIRKKLYLSAKITESMRNIHTSDGQESKKRKRGPFGAAAIEDDAPHLDTASLQSLIRRGAQTLARPELDVTEMLDWDWQTTLEKCKDQPVDTLVADQSGNTTSEQEWLNSMEKVETAIFEGKTHQKEIERQVEEIKELNRVDRRVGKNTTVEIDGFMINKESLNCADWEAVPTFAGKDPRLAEPKRAKKATIVNQDFCQTCWAGGSLVLCKGCPRSYHRDCMSKEMKARSLGMSFYCSQHECRDCGAKTNEAGGMIYRCRWCENGFCEDCLDFEKTKHVGHSLPEFEINGFGPVTQAYFIECSHCVDTWEQDPVLKKTVEKAKMRYEKEYKKHLAEHVDESFDAVSGATPDTISEAVTPVPEVMMMMPQRSSTGKKRKTSAGKALSLSHSHAHMEVIDLSED